MNHFAASSFLLLLPFSVCMFAYFDLLLTAAQKETRIVSVPLSEDGVCRARGPGDHYRNGSPLFITGFQENKQIEREDNVFFSFIFCPSFSVTF